MCGLLDLRTICDADGRTVLHLHSDDPAKDIAELSAELLARFEVIVERQSIHLLERFPPLSSTTERSTRGNVR